MQKILILPDVHLGKSTNLGKDISGGSNSRVQDQKNLLDFALKEAVSNKVERIVLTGDIWEEYHPKSNVVVIFIEWVKRCLDSNIYVDIIQGNHDFTRTGSKQSSMLEVFNAIDFPKCKVYNKIETINCGGNLAITYVPFTDRRQLQQPTVTDAITELTKQIDEHKVTINKFWKAKNHIIIGHLALEGSLWVGDELNEDSNEIFCPVSMFNGFSHVFMGHIHKPQVLRNENPYMEHVGSMDKTSFGEGDKSLTLVTVDIFDAITVEHIALPVRNLVDISIIIPADCQDQTAYTIAAINEINLKTKIDNSIVRIKIESNTQSTLNREELSNALSVLNVHNVSSISEISKTEKVLKDDLGIDESIDHKKAIELYINSLKTYDDNIKSEVLTFCTDIITNLKLEGDA